MNYVYLYFCYFTFGYCLSFPGVATQFIMIDVLHFSPVEMTMAMGIISSPWTMKPLFGFLSDKYEIFDWGRRRPYIAFGGLTAAFMYVYIEHFMASKQMFTFALAFVSANVCFADVCADSITVEHVKNEDIKGKLQSNCWISRAFGTLIGAFFGGAAYNTFGGIVVFQLVSISPVIMSAMIWCLPKHYGSTSDNLLRLLCDNITQQMSLVFIFFFMNISPDYGILYSYFLKTELGYNPQQFAWMGVSSSLSFLLSMILFKYCFLKKRPSTTIMIGIFGSTAFRITQLLVVSKIFPHFWLVLFDGVAESFFGQLIMMPLIVKAAEGCNDGVEGSIYAILMSISNLSNICGDWFGGVLGALFDVTETKFDNLGCVMVVSITAGFFIPFLVILKSSSFFSLHAKTSENKQATSENKQATSENKQATSANKLGTSANKLGTSGNTYSHSGEWVSRLGTSGNMPASMANIMAKTQYSDNDCV